MECWNKKSEKKSSNKYQMVSKKDIMQKSQKYFSNSSTCTFFGADFFSKTIASGDLVQDCITNRFWKQWTCKNILKTFNNK